MSAVHQKSWYLVPLASLTIAVGGPATVIALTEFAPGSIVFFRCLIAVTILSFFLRRKVLSAWRRLDRYGKTLLFGSGVATAGYIGFYVGGLAHTSYVSAVTLLSLQPVGVLLIGTFVFDERPTKTQLLGVALAIIGSAVVSFDGLSGNNQQHHFFGDLLLIVAVLFYSGYYAAHRALRDHAEETGIDMRRLSRNLALTTISFSIAGVIALFYACISFFGSDAVLRVPSQPAWMAILVSGLVPMLLGQTLCQLAARRLHPAWVSLISPGDTLFSVFMGIALLKVLPTYYETLGGVIILIGVLLVGVSGRYKKED